MGQMKWFKVASDIFEDTKIKLIKHMPNGRGIVLIWFELLALAGKEFTDGCFSITDDMSISDEMLATAIDEDLPTVRLALNIFEKFGMIEIVNDTIVTIANWEKYQSLDRYEIIKEQNAIRARKHRAKKKQQLLDVPPEENVENIVTLPSRDSVTLRSRDVTLEKEKENENEIRMRREVEESKEEKTPTAADKELFSYYQEKIRPLASGVDTERLHDLLNDYGLNLCLKAIDRAVLRKKRSIRYISGILKSWQQDGYDEPEDNSDDGRYVKRSENPSEEINNIPF